MNDEKKDTASQTTDATVQTDVQSTGESKEIRASEGGIGSKTEEKATTTSHDKDKQPAPGKRDKKEKSPKKKSFLYWSVLAGLIAIVWSLRTENLKLKEALDPYLAPLMENIPKFNMSDFEAQHGFRLPELFSGDEEPRPGRDLRAQGLRPRHPVVIVPGFVTSGLELWQGKPCARKYFRHRFWGSFTMTQGLFSNKSCWMEHMALNASDGLDPTGIKLRAAEGLLGVDYFMPGYFVWAKLIEALADLGYDSNNVIGVTYDWRLAVPNMEKRDGYFTRLKMIIELAHTTQGEKALVASHSWGDSVFRMFMVWVEDQTPGWLDAHVAHYANIAGPALGVPKAITSLLSGETRDTAELGLIGAFLSDNFVPRNERVRLFRTWGSGLGMLPNGGPAIWGNATWAPDDTPAMRANGTSFGNFFSELRVTDTPMQQARRQRQKITDAIAAWYRDLRNQADPAQLNQVRKHHDIDGAMQILLNSGSDKFREQVRAWGAVHADPRSCSVAHDVPGKFFFSPLKCPLANAPSMRMYCMYGVGNPTERAYHYLNLESREALKEVERAHNDQPQTEIPWKIDIDASDPGRNLDHGVRTTDGDGTVPLISLGVLCRKHWRNQHLNPSGFPVITREYKHEPTSSLVDMRGGPKSADHIDILGNADVLADIVTIAAGAGDRLEDRILSRVDEIAKNIALDAE